MSQTPLSEASRHEGATRPSMDTGLERERGPDVPLAPGSHRNHRPIVIRQRRHRRWGLAVSDCLAILFSGGFAYVIGRLDTPNLLWTLTIIPVWLLIAKIYNLYDRDDRRIHHSTIEEIPQLVATGAITVVVVKGITEALHLPHFPSASLIAIVGASVILAFLLRGITRQLYREFGVKERAIVVGSGPKADLVARRLHLLASDGIEFAGYISHTSKDFRAKSESFGVPMNKITDRLDELVQNTGIVRVVIAEDGLSDHEISHLLSACHAASIAVTMVPSHQAVLGPGTELNRLGEVPMFDFHVSVPPRSSLAIKRLFDIVMSGTLLILAAPILLVSSIMIKLDSKGPVFYRQIRVGRAGREFGIYKLRSMVVNAEKLDNRLDQLARMDSLDGSVNLKESDDPRITRVGGILRRFSIDEIPQFLNVLKGDMSMVGPRPEIPSVVATYDERQMDRLKVKPGVTGPMQVSGRGMLNFDERVALERDYLDNLTLTNDIVILLQTPKAVLRGDGAF